MGKVVRLNESQVDRLFIIQESSGVNDVMFKVADLIARQISFRDIFEILSNVRLLDNWHEEYDETYKNEVEYDGKTYPYEVFYEAGSLNGIRRGETDGETVSVNFYLIESVIAEYNEMERLVTNRYSYDEDEEEEFDAYRYSKEALYGCPGIEYDIYKIVYPIILHELTHVLGNGDPMDRLWIKPVNRFNEEDVRDYMYTFSASEMNSRIASAPSILLSTLKLDYAEKDIEQVIESGAENYFFTEDLMPKVMKNVEIDYSHMKTLVGLLESYSTHFPVSKEYLEDCLATKHTKFVNSLFFHLATNEDKLYKRSNPRQVLKLYASDPRKFEQKVAGFYRNLFEQYKKRIYKACWYVFTNYAWEVADLDDEYEKNVRSWHEKIWGEDE